MDRAQGKKRSMAVAIILAVIAAAFLGMAFVLQPKTLVEWWRPAVLCAAPATLLGLAASKVIKSEKSILIFICSMAFSFSILLGSCYTLNFYRSDSASGEKINAVVTSKFSEEHYRTRRLSRNRSVRGEPYLAYYLNLELPDGRIKKIEVGAGEYSKTRSGQKISLFVEMGCFGMPVIKNLSFPVRKVKE